MAGALDTFGDLLAGTFGHPVDREGAQLQGYNIGSQINLRSANTEEAFAQARERRAKAVLDEQINARRQQAQEHPELVGGTLIEQALGSGYGNFDQVTQGANNIDIGKRAALIADPNTAPAAAIAARAANAPSSYHQTRVEGGMLLDDAAPADPAITPVGQAQVDAAHALAGQRVANTGVGVNVNPEAVESIAQMVASGAMPMLTGRALTTPMGLAIAQRVPQINPDFQSSTAPTRAATAKNFAVGVEGRKVRSLNTAIAHMDTIEDYGRALDNNDIPAANAALNFLAKQTGDPRITSFESARNIVGQEVVAAVVANGGSLQERQEAQQAFQTAQSPAQLAAVLQGYRELLAGQMQSLQQQYEQGSGLKDFNRFLAPRTLQRLQGLAGGTPPNASPAGPTQLTNPGAGPTVPTDGAVQTITGSAGDEVPVAPPAAIAYLKAHPESIDAFVAKYRYNPRDYEPAQ